MVNNKVKIKKTRAIAEEKKFLWISRVLFLFIIISLISNIILFFVATNLVPNVKIQPFFIEAQNVKDKDILVYRSFQNLNTTATSNEKGFYKMAKNSPSYKIAENYVKNYIVDRETVTRDNDFMHSVWGDDSDVFYLSDENVYKRFSETTVFNDIIRDRKINSWEKVVEITDLDYQSEAQRWIANVIIRYIYPSGNMLNAKNFTSEIKRKFIIEGKYDLNVMKKNQKDVYKNPLGFKITNYYFKKV